LQAIVVCKSVNLKRANIIAVVIFNNYLHISLGLNLFCGHLLTSEEELPKQSH